jgi:hypothetical protein
MRVASRGSQRVDSALPGRRGAAGRQVTQTPVARTGDRIAIVREAAKKESE